MSQRMGANRHAIRRMHQWRAAQYASGPSRQEVAACGRSGRQRGPERWRRVSDRRLKRTPQHELQPTASRTESPHKSDVAPAERQSIACQGAVLGTQASGLRGMRCGVTRTGMARTRAQSAVGAATPVANPARWSHCLGLGSWGQASLGQDSSFIRVRGLTSWRGVSLDCVSLPMACNCRT